jgi:hypothetical protein
MIRRDYSSFGVRHLPFATVRLAFRRRNPYPEDLFRGEQPIGHRELSVPAPNSLFAAEITRLCHFNLATRERAR